LQAFGVAAQKLSAKPFQLLVSAKDNIFALSNQLVLSVKIELETGCWQTSIALTTKLKEKMTKYQNHC